MISKTSPNDLVNGYYRTPEFFVNMTGDACQSIGIWIPAFLQNFHQGLPIVTNKILHLSFSISDTVIKSMKSNNFKLDTTNKQKLLVSKCTQESFVSLVLCQRRAIWISSRAF